MGSLNQEENMENQHNILGSQEEKKGIEELLQQAGKDPMIDAIVKGKDAIPSSDVILRRIESALHPSNINSIAFSPNGKYIATACYDNNCIREFKFDGEHLGRPELSIDYSRVCALAYKDNENHFLVATPKTIYYGNHDEIMASGDFKDRLELYHDAALVTLSYNQNAECIITGDDEGNLRFFGFIQDEIREIKSPIRISEKEITAAAFSPDGKFFAAADGAKTLHMYRFLNNVNNERCLLDSTDFITPSFVHNSFETYGLAFSPDNQRLVMATQKGLMLLGKGKLSELSFNEAHAVAFSPNGKYLAVSYGSYDKNDPASFMELYKIIEK